MFILGFCSVLVLGIMLMFLALTIADAFGAWPINVAATIIAILGVIMFLVPLLSPDILKKIVLAAGA